MFVLEQPTTAGLAKTNSISQKELLFLVGHDKPLNFSSVFSPKTIFFILMKNLFHHMNPILNLRILIYASQYF